MKFIAAFFERLKTLDGQLSLFLLFFLLVAVGCNIFGSWVIFRHGALLNEAAVRPRLAAESRWFYDSGNYEPVPVGALKILSPFDFSPDAAVRAEGMALAVLIIAAVFVSVKRKWGEQTAVFSAFLLGINPYLAIYAMKGSTVLFSLFFLLLFWLFARPGTLTLKRAAAAGFFAGLACLSRMDSVWPLLLYALFSARVCVKAGKLKETAAAAVTALLLVSPYLIYQKAHFGNALYGQETGLTRLVNAEVRKYLPGTELIKEPVALGEFLTRYGFRDAVAAPFRGAYRLLTFELPKSLYGQSALGKFTLLLAFLGLYFSFRRSDYDFPVLFLSFFIPVCFIAEIPQISDTSGIRVSYMLPSAAAVCAMAGYGFTESCRELGGAVKKYLEKSKR